MSDATITVVVPTVGRHTLGATLESAREADQIILVLDEAGIPGLLPDIPDWPHIVTANVIGGDHGYTARTKGITLATGTHLAFMDDDDVYLPGAIRLMRDAACDRPVIFRMNHYNHGVLWRDQTVRFGNVSTQMILVPNDHWRLGRWIAHAPGMREPGGDYTFLQGCCERMGAPVWREEVISDLRPTLVAA